MSNYLFDLLSFVPTKESNKEKLSGFLELLSFEPSKESNKEKLPAVKSRVKNLLKPASPDKLLAALVGQYLRSRLSYGFLHTLEFNAG